MPLLAEGTRRVRLEGLWRHADFRRLWIGRTISYFGDEVTHLALPLTAALVLGAGPEQMGMLGAAERLPFVCVSLFAGVWVDRVRRRPLLIAADAARAVLLGSIPVAALCHALHMEHLYIVAFFAAAVSVIAAVADRALLPALVGRDALVEGNAKLWMSTSVAQSGGPGLAGVLVQWLGAPLAIAADALSFVVSALCLSGLRTREEEPKVDPASRGVLDSVRAGLRLVIGNRVLWTIVLCGGTHNFASSMLLAAYTLYVTRELGVSPGWLGVVLVAGGIGSLAGSLVVERITLRLGMGRALIASQVATGMARILIPLAAGPGPVVIATLAVSELLLGAARAVFNVNQLSLRQAITPMSMQGRVNASMSFLLWTVSPLGSLAGGFLGAAIGLRPALFVAASGVMLATLWALRPALRSFERVPVQAMEGAAFRVGGAEQPKPPAPDGSLDE